MVPQCQKNLYQIASVFVLGLHDSVGRITNLGTILAEFLGAEMLGFILSLPPHVIGTPL